MNLKSFEKQLLMSFGTGSTPTGLSSGGLPCPHKIFDQGILSDTDYYRNLISHVKNIVTIGKDTRAVTVRLDGSNAAEYYDVFLSGVWLLKFFVQTNFTGPVVELDEESLGFLTELDELLRSALVLDGGDIQGNVHYPCVLGIAKGLFSVVPVELIQSVVWWKMRCDFLHESILEEKSNLLWVQIKSCEEILRKGLLSLVESKFLAGMLCLELGQMYLFHYDVTTAKALVSYASTLIGIKNGLEDALGKRTSYTQKELAELIVQVTSVDLSFESDNDLSVTAEELPRDLQLDDDTRLNKIQLSHAKPEGSLGPMQQIMLLNLYFVRKGFQAQDEVCRTECEAFLGALLDTPRIWAVQFVSLFHRSILEKAHARTIARSLEQLEVLKENFGASSPPSHQRLPYFFVSYMPLWCQVDSAIADILINPKESSGAFSQEVLGNGDTLIFRTLIPMMKDVNVLKTCRSVCKSWNKFACEALTKLPSNYYSIYEHLDGNAADFVALIEGNKNLGLPPPFRNLKVLAGNFRKESFLRCLKYVCINANNYSVELHIFSSDVDLVELQNVLTLNTSNFKITKLFLSGKIIGDGPIPGADIFQPEIIRLPYLEMLDIGTRPNIWENEEMSVLIENICHHSPLKELFLTDIPVIEKLKKMISPTGIKFVEKMTLDFSGYVSPEDWEYICARMMKIPFIKKLGVSVSGLNGGDDRYCNALKTVIEHFADSLVSLTAPNFPVIKNKCFPKLREIWATGFASIGELYYPVERFPLLKKATFSIHRVESILEYTCVEEISLGIENLILRLNGKDPDNRHMFISLAGIVLPKVSRFSIVTSGKMSPSLLSVICKSFPKLTALHLDVGETDDRILSGWRIKVDEWLQNGWPLERIPRDASLLDFQGLEELSFGSNFVITSHLFTWCLSKISTLKYLTFYMNGVITAANIRDSVGHLKGITVILPRATISARGMHRKLLLRKY